VGGIAKYPPIRIEQCSRGPTVRTTPCQVIQGQLHLWISAGTARRSLSARGEPPVRPRSLSNGLSADEEAGPLARTPYRTPLAA
jgi:hypothetical protein